MMAGEHKLHLVQLRVHRGHDVEYEILAPPRIRGCDRDRHHRRLLGGRPPASTIRDRIGSSGVSTALGTNFTPTVAL